MRSRVICIPLMSRFQLWTDSIGTLKKRPLEIPGLDGLLPHAEGIWVESRITLAGSQKNDATNFGAFYYRQHLRLELVWKLVTGSSAKQGELSANMYVKTAGM